MVHTQVKQQVTDRDSLFLLAKYQDYEAGDNFPHYDPAWASRHLRVKESQAPILLAAVHREWQPGAHTTLLAGWLQDDFDSRGEALVLDLRTNANGTLHSVVGREFDETRYENDYSAGSVELNQLLQGERTILNAGVRVQWGSFNTTTRLDQPGAPPSFTNRFEPPVYTSLDECFARFTPYAYLTRELWPHFRLTAGLAYDHLEYPDGFRSVPVAPTVRTEDRLLPKAAITWDALPALTLRGMYAQSLGGIAFDDSVRLEPTQLAGFAQAYRTVISEAEAGSVIAPKQDVAGAALDLKLTPGPFAGLQGQWMHSEVDQSLGVFTGSVNPPASSSSTPERLNYHEWSLGLSLQQLIGTHWSAGVRYQWTDSTLGWDYPAIPEGTLLQRLPGSGSSLSRSSMPRRLPASPARLGVTPPSPPVPAGTATPA